MRKARRKKRKFLKFISFVLCVAIVVTGVTAVRANVVYAKLNKAQKQDIVQPTIDFVQPSMLVEYTDSDYDTYFNYLESAGYSKVILQFTRYQLGGVTNVYYESEGLKDFYENVDDTYKNVLGDLLRNAKKHDFGVYVGLSVDDQDWWGVVCNFDKEFMDKLGKVDALMIEEINEKYGDEEAFIGWYWAHELYSNPVGIENIWAKLINVSIDKLNEIGDGKPMMISPFRHVQTGLVTVEYLMWTNFFKQVNFREGDIFAPQDSFGKLNQSHWEGPSKLSYLFIYDYLNACDKAVAKEDGLIYWVNVENWQKKDAVTYDSGSFDRVKLQLANASRVTDTLITFSTSHYALPIGTNDTEENRTKLYNDYVEFFK